MKNHGVEFDELLLNELREQYNKAQAKILKQNGNDLEQRAEQYVVGIYGSKVRQIYNPYYSDWEDIEPWICIECRTKGVTRNDAGRSD